MTTRQRGSLLREIVALLAAYALASALAAALFIAIMRSGLLSAFTVMFYRGLVGLALTGLVVLALLAFALPRLSAFGLSARDAIGATLVALALNVAVFTLGPVTVDRSISVFMLSRFEKADRPLSERDMRDAFVATYVDEWRQMGRRLAEQETSGNLERTPEGWRLTARGRAFMESARAMSRWFDGDPRFVGR
jgi:hypothetical protein